MFGQFRKFWHLEYQPASKSVSKYVYIYIYYILPLMAHQICSLWWNRIIVLPLRNYHQRSAPDNWFTNTHALLTSYHVNPSTKWVCCSTIIFLLRQSSTRQSITKNCWVRLMLHGRSIAKALVAQSAWLY